MRLIPLFSAAVALALTACQTAESGTPSAPLDGGGTTVDNGGQGDPNAKSPTPPKPYALGKLDDDDIEKIIYTALEKKLAAATAAGAEKQELGDIGSFEFSVIKLMRDGDEVAGPPADPPNMLEIEVRGWYRRTLAGDAPPVCASFDTAVVVSYTKDGWALAPEQQLRFAREDQEDCY